MTAEADDRWYQDRLGDSERAYALAEQADEQALTDALYADLETQPDTVVRGDLAAAGASYCTCCGTWHDLFASCRCAGCRPEDEAAARRVADAAYERAQRWRPYAAHAPTSPRSRFPRAA